ncbi:predicted protein [Lichtheimia corymbifera JMRC:FSU:9682]|uniref:Uncharacterized protein n=1 Tax=Lichtheimia corymbifera JMRC:FSU:9682 TaxID=1263082 RepID=A0A068S2W3_9FUNG|nr:predicted protein [Lichtheimia corymbifera JMRC:FSU:9682]
MHLLTKFEVKMSNLKVMDHLRCAWNWLTNLISSSSTCRILPLLPIPICCPIQVQQQPAIDCPASTHHVNPTTVLIRLSLTGWRVHGVCTTLQHSRFLTRHLLLYNPQPPSNVAAFIPAVVVSKVFTALFTALSFYYNTCSCTLLCCDRT